jgi:bifunctional UDP-N-acetylglucosamine pyrophosphorylase / glucosamine-1-phosphate N-acetyltransferase
MGSKRPLDVIILAAGKGVRMRTPGAKVLQSICGRTLVRHVVNAARALKPARIVVVVGHEADRVRAELADEKVVFIDQGKPQGTGHAVLQAAPLYRRGERDVLILCGDVPLVTPAILRKLRDRHRRSDADATMLSFTPDDAARYGRVIRDAKGGVTAIREWKDCSSAERRITEVNSGIYVFRSKPLFKALPAVGNDNKSGEFYLTDVPGLLLDGGGRVTAVMAPDADEVRGVNSLMELAEAARVLRYRILGDLMSRGVSIIDPATTFVEAGVKVGTGTIIYPFSIIMTGVVIGHDCRVGPFSHLRGNAVLAPTAEVGNFVEVKKSHIGPKSKAKHLAYIGDATIGKGVNVGAGTITANWDGKDKHPTTIGDSAYIGSNTVFVAPVKMGRGAKTGAGSVVLSGRDIPDGATVAGVPARVVKDGKKKGRRR